ncbi:NAD-dependent epimerase/dehydratase family protein [bacterium]|nr:NAD-dependent epimerase/dehydratase family protein [bacterium]
MTRVLLTGATGFVGAQVLRHLVAAGAEVTVTLRPGAALPDGAAGAVHSPDLFAEDARFWAKACDGHDAVTHVAWYAEPGKYLHSPLNLDCLAGTVRLAQGAAAAGVRHFSGIGTCFEYDLTTAALARHEALPTNAPLAPATPYGAAKAAVWLALSRNLTGLNFAWCRLFYLYGAGEDPRRLVPYVHQRLAAGLPVELTSGQQWRDFLDVAEAGRQIAEVTLQGLEGALNICSGRPVTVAGLAAGIAESYGRPDLIRLGARPDRADDPPYVVGLPSLPPKA